jgi:hypothetical protein
MIQALRPLPLLVAATLLVEAPYARAEPTAPSIVCKTYPTLPACSGRVPACALCHDSTDPPSWNLYGGELKAQLSAGQPFDAALPGALAAVADDDADGDGTSNLEELQQGRSPSVQDAVMVGTQGTVPNPGYRIDEWDAKFAYRRLSALYCGRSPSYDEMNDLAEESSAEGLKQLVHAKLDQCLRSPYWRQEGLARLADKRIRPVVAFGTETKIVIGNRSVVLGDFEYDYNLWRYALTDGHDMREMLTAQFHVRATEDGKLQKVEGVIEKPNPNWVSGGQPVEPQNRAGLLTTQWFITYMTMFSAVPRVTAAQAYRAYLGADIANLEGLRPVEGEPLDIDNKAVAAPRCAQCHSTLDPLSYPFAEYEGVVLSPFVTFGGYDPGRPRRMIPAWDPARQKSVLLGKPVKNLLEWAQVAVASDEFKRNLADMFFQHALHRTPSASELSDFNALWQSAEDDGFSAERMIHRVVDTHAFGSP